MSSSTLHLNVIAFPKPMKRGRKVSRGPKSSLLSFKRSVDEVKARAVCGSSERYEKLRQCMLQFEKHLPAQKPKRESIDVQILAPFECLFISAKEKGLMTDDGMWIR